MSFKPYRVWINQFCTSNLCSILWTSCINTAVVGSVSRCSLISCSSPAGALTRGALLEQSTLSQGSLNHLALTGSWCSPALNGSWLIWIPIGLCWEWYCVLSCMCLSIRPACCNEMYHAFSQDKVHLYCNHVCLLMSYKKYFNPFDVKRPLLWEGFQQVLEHLSA